MSIIEKLQSALPGDSGLSTYEYECPDCGREFEAEAPPERVYCSSCGNAEIQRRTE